MAKGFVYLTAVVDVASPRVLTHKVAITLEACHAREIMAFTRFGTPEIVNTDQGSQFTADEFTEVVLAKGCKLSMDGRGSWRDNVFVERITPEQVYPNCYQNWPRLHKMKFLVRPELPAASVGSSQASPAALDNSAPLATRPKSTYKSGKVVQTSGATSEHAMGQGD
jgi:hypothetical protein